VGKKDPNEERRNSQRFPVSWDVAVTGIDGAGRYFDETGTLQNLSSNGAFLYLPGRTNPGESIELQIRIPLKRNNWMKYSAQVVRLERENGRAGVAVRFDTAVPVFVAR
jgi:hypothetical protein